MPLKCDFKASQLLMLRNSLEISIKVKQFRIKEELDKDIQYRLRRSIQDEKELINKIKAFLSQCDTSGPDHISGFRFKIGAGRELFPAKTPNVPNIYNHKLKRLPGSFESAFK